MTSESHSPKRVLTAGIAVLAILLLVVMTVVPKFEEVFRGLPGGTGGLSGITRFMMQLSKWLVEYWWAVLGGLVALLLFERARTRKV